MSNTDIIKYIFLAEIDLRKQCLKTLRIFNSVHTILNVTPYLEIANCQKRRGADQLLTFVIEYLYRRMVVRQKKFHFLIS